MPATALSWELFVQGTAKWDPFSPLCQASWALCLQCRQEARLPAAVMPAGSGLAGPGSSLASSLRPRACLSLPPYGCSPVLSRLCFHPSFQLCCSLLPGWLYLTGGILPLLYLSLSGLSLPRLLQPFSFPLLPCLWCSLPLCLSGTTPASFVSFFSIFSYFLYLWASFSFFPESLSITLSREITLSLVLCVFLFIPLGPCILLCLSESIYLFLLICLSL